MQRRKFIQITSSAALVAAGAGYLLSDKRSFVRSDIVSAESGTALLNLDELAILYLASLAPSGHNTQPWTVRVIEPGHWIIGNDQSRWLPAVDPLQRETILSIGAFLQNLEYAAAHYGYRCDFKLLASANQQADIMEVRLVKHPTNASFDIEDIKLRRTVRSGFLNDALNKEDISYLTKEDAAFFHFIPNSSNQYNQLNELTIEANRMQSSRDDAERELAKWIRFSNNDARKNLDGLTTAGMEITGLPGWLVRNFYGKNEVMKRSFRDQSIDKVKQQVSSSGGWIILSAEDSSVETLVETGKRFQRLLLKIRKKNIAIHPMTQTLEEGKLSTTINQIAGISGTVQFVLRAGYLKNYPAPVSLRRPVDWFVKE